MKLEFSQQTFEKKLKYQVLPKSGQWEPSCCMRTDRRAADMTKVIVALRNFAKAPKKLIITVQVFDFASAAFWNTHSTSATT